MSRRVVLIDLDDTLWDTRSNNRQSLRELYTALNWGQYFVSFEDFEALYLPINVHLWEEFGRGKVSKRELSIERLRRPLSGYLELSDEQWLRINDEFMELVRQKRGLCPGALETLSYLHQHYEVVIVSNGFGSVQYSKLRDTGLSDYVDRVVLSEDVGINKPDRRIFEYALSLGAGFAPSEAVMVGDSWTADIIGASNAEIPSIWYNPDGNLMADLPRVANPPLYTIRHLTELTHLL